MEVQQRVNALLGQTEDLNNRALIFYTPNTFIIRLNLGKEVTFYIIFSFKCDLHV